MILISAMSRDRVIGAGAGMPWSVPEEYNRYRDTVLGATVIFGRKSFEIFGPDLPGTRLIVVTSRPEIAGAEAANDLPAAFKLATSGDAERDDRRVFVAGGASIYEQALPLAERMYLSVIRGEYQGDAYFPEFDPSDWRVERHEEHERYEFFDYARV